MTTTTTQRYESILSMEERDYLINHLSGVDQEDIRNISQKVTTMITSRRALTPPYTLNDDSMREYTCILIDRCSQSPPREKTCLITAEIERMVKELNRFSCHGYHNYMNDYCIKTTFRCLSTCYFSMRHERSMRSEWPDADILEEIIGKEMLAFTSEIQPPLQEEMWAAYTSRVLQNQISIYVTKNDIDKFLEITALLPPTIEQSWGIETYKNLIKKNNPEQIKKIIGSRSQAFREFFCTYLLVIEGRHDLIQKVIDSIDDLPKKISLLQYIAAEHIAPCQEMQKKISGLRRQVNTIGREVSNRWEKVQFWDTMIWRLIHFIDKLDKIRRENALPEGGMASLEAEVRPPGGEKASSTDESDSVRMEKILQTSVKDDPDGIVHYFQEQMNIYENRLFKAKRDIERLEGEKYRASERWEIAEEEQSKRLNLSNGWLIQGLQCATELPEPEKLKFFQQINKTALRIASDPRLETLVNSLCEKNQFMDALILKILRYPGGDRDVYEGVLQEEMSWGDDPARRDQCLLEFITRIIPQLDVDVIHDIDPIELASCIHDLKMQQAAVRAIRERDGDPS